jgi:hypothetical protein
VYLEPIDRKELSCGAVRKPASILGEITLRKSQVHPRSRGSTLVPPFPPLPGEMFLELKCRTLRITGSKKQSEERAALFAVRVHAIVGLQVFAKYPYISRNCMATHGFSTG